MPHLARRCAPDSRFGCGGRLVRRAVATGPVTRSRDRVTRAAVAAHTPVSTYGRKWGTARRRRAHVGLAPARCRLAGERGVRGPRLDRGWKPIDEGTLGARGRARARGRAAAPGFRRCLHGWPGPLRRGRFPGSRNTAHRAADRDVCGLPALDPGGLLHRDPLCWAGHGCCGHAPLRRVEHPHVSRGNAILVQPLSGHLWHGGAASGSPKRERSGG